ncbi:hypothetical protein QBC46DRAFT_407609 [Diplogelasinospora grovesii]|uniref:Secreted protein n=1 Tax=Diplogelasinospora grovesii TaxID=303347 RepID=A0AAN6S5D2_9PEZI|nr:hypothetical protein QBC46DRAFT_407609 [Diplogelasinospora grovesii]
MLRLLARALPLACLRTALCAIRFDAQDIGMGKCLAHVYLPSPYSPKRRTTTTTCTNTNHCWATARLSATAYPGPAPLPCTFTVYHARSPEPAHTTATLFRRHVTMGPKIGKPEE